MLTPAQIKPQSVESRRNFFFFFTQDGYVSCLRACLDAMLHTVLLVPKLQALVYILPSTIAVLEEGTGKRCSECDLYPNFPEGADRVGGQLRGDKECPFSGVTKSGRVWRNVPESDARSLEEGAGKRCSECGSASDITSVGGKHRT